LNIIKKLTNIEIYIIKNKTVINGYKQY
jgi:hypothetical protein